MREKAFACVECESMSVCVCVCVGVCVRECVCVCVVRVYTKRVIQERAEFKITGISHQSTQTV